MKIGCVIFFFGKKYEALGNCAVSSFKAWHPDIDLLHVNEHNVEEFDASRFFKKIPHGPFKYLLAYEALKTRGYDKIIILGADTITCGRLDEFINDNESDVVVTLDYPYQLVTPRFSGPDSESHLNSDVICFNNPLVIKEIINLIGHYPIYLDQGALNETIWSDQYNFKFNIADGPYEESKVVYNARAKGNITAGPGQKPWGKYTNKFYVKDNKLYTGDDKQIKVWHYCDGFGTISDNQFKALMNKWVFEWFNEDTKTFFKEHCGCGGFFEKEFAF